MQPPIGRFSSAAANGFSFLSARRDAALLRGLGVAALLAAEIGPLRARHAHPRALQPRARIPARSGKPSRSDRHCRSPCVGPGRRAWTMRRWRSRPRRLREEASSSLLASLGPPRPIILSKNRNDKESAAAGTRPAGHRSLDLFPRQHGVSSCPAFPAAPCPTPAPRPSRAAGEPDPNPARDSSSSATTRRRRSPRAPRLPPAWRPPPRIPLVRGRRGGTEGGGRKKKRDFELGAARPDASRPRLRYPRAWALRVRS